VNWRTAVVLLGTGFGIHAQGQLPPLAAQATPPSQGVPAQTAQAQGAQDSVGASQVAQVSAADRPLGEAMPRSYAGSECLSGLSQQKVKRAVVSLKAALESEARDARSRALKEGEQLLVEAIEKDKQDKNAGAWYSLAQIYLYQDNVTAADTALRRATALAPGCRADMDDLRYSAWAPLMNGGIELSKAQHKDSALALFRKAVVISPDKPQGALNAGVIYANSGQLDSAAVYFGKAAEVAERAKMVEERNRGTFNMAAMLQQLSRHAEAVQALEKYLGWVPDDRDAKEALATSYRAAGQTEKAQALDKELLATAGPVAAGDSAAAGSREGSRRAPSAAAVAMRVGVNFYNDKKYADAAGAFAKVIETEPHNRDAIYNLANTYYAMKDHAKLIETSTKLIAIEPMSEDALQMLGNGYKNANDIDRAVKIAEQLLAMPLNVVVKEFMTQAEGAKLTMTATGRAAQTPTGKAIPPAPLTLTFDFLDATGAVMVTQDAELPAVKAEQVHEFVLDVKGKGIAAWRYAKKRQ
jgi:tetratricopeptide (TPR) repeat protein